MRSSRKIFTYLALVLALLVGVSPAYAESSSNTSHQVVREDVTWTLTPDNCKSINAVVDGSGKRREEISTKVNSDGSTRQIIEDLVTGTAVDANGLTYKFIYVNHSTWTTPVSGTPTKIKMDDLFVLKGDKSSVNNLRVAFRWGWTFDPLTKPYWPPEDNFVQSFTLGDPFGCDPI